MSSTRRRPSADELAAIKDRIAGLSRDEKIALAARTKPIVDKRQNTSVDRVVNRRPNVPQTDDELWEWIKSETGYEIPRVAVCSDHNAPFDFIADAYFERESALFLLGSREMGKTLGVSILHFVNSETKPGTESLTFGAIEPQARRAYKHLKSFVYDETYHDDGSVTRALRSSVDGEPLRSETRWKNGSMTEIVVGSKSGVNSPHPQKVHADEVDLMGEDVWDESRSMSSSKMLPSGLRIKAQDFATSTRKSMTGLVQKILDEVDDAVTKGMEPSWRVYRSCVFENAEEMPDCQRAPAIERAVRLAELGRDPCELCSCHLAAKGELADGVPRTLDSVCRGRFFKSRGWMPHEDVRRKFRASPQAYWDAQMECRRPMADGLYLPGWLRERFTVSTWIPKPELGDCWTGTDWGGSAPSAILWSQGPLRIPVLVRGVDGREVEIPRGAYVVFDEYYEADVGATKLADIVLSRELSWRRQVPGFRVKARFADMAGAQQRADWRQHKPPLITSWYLTDSTGRAFDPMVKCLQGLVEDKRYWVSSRCGKHMDDIESWRQKDGKEQHDDSSHGMAASRYLHGCTEARERRRNHQEPANSVKPLVVQRKTNNGVAVSNRNGGVADFSGEEWRKNFGGPVPVSAANVIMGPGGRR